MSKYMEILGAATPGAPTTTAIVQSNNPGALQSALASDGKLLLTTVALTVAGGVAGYKVWKKHPVLGALTGLTAGGSIVPMVKGNNVDRARTILSAAGLGGGVALSLGWKKHPAWGYILGSIAASGAASAVAGRSAV